VAERVTRVSIDTTETRTPAAPVPPIWIERIAAEYREMPGLRLTLPQAARLWALDQASCAAVLVCLEARGDLQRTPDGRYGVASDLRRPRRRAG